MNLRSLREEVLDANLELARRNLVIYTFGNASGIWRQGAAPGSPDQSLVVIKPSGVSYERLRAEDLVVTDLEGRIVEGTMRPSSDLATHLILYKAFPNIGGVVHTHSPHATAWAQSKREIPCLGTTHADYFHGPIPITEELREEEIHRDYEVNTGRLIARRFASLDPERAPGVLVPGHGPFTWGQDAAAAAHMAVILEELARMAYLTLTLEPSAGPLGQALHDKHFLRKHGPAAYYGQKKH
jgi:L-ribulose-5-phosphate 4-epimerase